MTRVGHRQDHITKRGIKFNLVGTLSWKVGFAPLVARWGGMEEEEARLFEEAEGKKRKKEEAKGNGDQSSRSQISQGGNSNPWGRNNMKKGGGMETGKKKKFRGA